MKKIIKISVLIVFLIFLGDVGSGAWFWHRFNEAKAANACPVSEGGSVLLYTPSCILTAGVCSCSVLYGNTGVCATYAELQITAQNGTAVIGIPAVGTEIVGGPIPKAKDPFLGCLVSNISPMVLGFPSASAMRTQKLAQFFEKIWQYIS